MDCELPNGECYQQHLADLAERDRMVAAAVDRSVSLVLTAKFSLGLFEQPFVNEQHALVVPPQADEIALTGAEEGMVLLKNGRLLIAVESF